MGQLQVVFGPGFVAVEVKNTSEKALVNPDNIFVVQARILGLFIKKPGLAFHQKQNTTVNIFVDVGANVVLKQVLVHILEKVGLVVFLREFFYKVLVAVIFNQLE